MEPSADKEAGLLTSLKRLVATTLAVVQNRVELLLVEAREQRFWAFEALFWVALVAVLGFMTLVMLTFAAVLIFWPEHRVAVVVALSLFYLLATLGALLRLRRHLADWPSFSATLGELKKDKACLEDKP